jgi:hypothetical protein
VTKYATDIYVNSSGKAGTYTTIAAAISAASAGDRIYISPYGLYVEDLTVAKSLTFASSVSGVNFNVDGTMEITANAGMDVRIVGGVFSGYLTATTNTASQNNMTDVYVIDSYFSYILLDENFVKAHLLFCESLGGVDIQNGEIVGCSLDFIDIEDGPNVGTGDTVKIIGNVVSGTGGVDIFNDDNYYMVMNNYIKSGLKIHANHYSSAVNNIFANNTISRTYNMTLIYFYNNASTNYSNFYFTNNLVLNGHSNSVGVSISEPGSDLPKFSYNRICTPVTSAGYLFEQVTGNSYGNDSDAAEIILTLDEYGRTTHSSVVDQGTPSIEYYDIDMTINDVGTYGGPYSMENYINNTNGKARIYDLDMPFEIWSGQTPTIKAKGAHTK